METNRCVRSLNEVSDRDLILCDITPRQLIAHRRRSNACALSTPPGTLSLRAGRIQNGLGAGRADPVESSGLRPHRHGAYWGNVG